MEFELTEGATDLDPRLQQWIEQRRRGRNAGATASTLEGEIAVIAKVADKEAWVALSEVQPGADIGPAPDGNGHIVTARIPLARLEYVRRQPFVVSLKPAQSLHPELADTIREIEARQDLLPPEAVGGQGRDVVIGIVDFGCDFAHRNFRRSDGSTRLLAIWNQNGAANAGSPFSYGTLYDQAAINAALTQANPYAALGYGPRPDQPGAPAGTHGTHVMDIAGGNGLGSGTPGVAPEADLVFVDVAASDIPWAGPDVLTSSFGDSVQLLEALRFIFDFAGNRPCVVNVSLGTNGGPHDGTTLVEQGIDALLAEVPNRAVVIAASNSFADGIHAAGRVPQQGSVDLRWQVQDADWTHNECEIWYSGSDRLRLELLAPDGTQLGLLDAGQSGRLTDNAGNVLLFAAHRVDDPNNHDNVIGIFLENTLPAGTWTLRLHAVQVQNGTFHAWIERDDNSPSMFVPPHDNRYTLGSISCGCHTIVVGSYDAHKSTVPLSWFSSSGPTRDGRTKLELSAPGHNVLAAHSRTGTGVTRKSGTSMAAPAVTGVVALLLSEARAHGIDLTIDEIRAVLRSSVQASPPDPTAGWDPRYGDGRVRAAAAVFEVLQATITP